MSHHPGQHFYLLVHERAGKDKLSSVIEEFQESLMFRWMQQQVLSGFQYSPAHYLSIVLINALLFKEANRILICPLLVRLGPLAHIRHN